MVMAPYIIACAILPIAILPSGIKTNAFIPAAYAAAATEVFPVDAQIIAFEPLQRL